MDIERPIEATHLGDHAMRITLKTANGVVLWRDNHCHTWDLSRASQREMLMDEIKTVIEDARHDPDVNLEDWER